MIELRFHHELYDGFAIDEAVKAFDGFATFELVREEHGYIVRVAAKDLPDGIDEQRIADELGNYALGKTIERSTAAAPAPAEGT